MADIGSLVASLMVDSASFKRDLNRAAQDTNSFSAKANRHLAQVQKKWNKISSAVFSYKGALVAAASAASLGYFIKRNLDAADAIGKTADRIGISTDKLQEFRFMANRAGVATSKLDGGLEAFTKRLGEARLGTGTLVTILNKMDEEFKNNILSAKSTDQALDILIDRMAGMTDASDKAALSAAFFGRSAGVEMVNIVRGGREEVDKLRNTFEDLGLAIDEDLIRNSEEANDRLTDLEAVIKTRLTSAAVSLAPEIGKIAEHMTAWITENDEFIRQKIPEYIDKITGAFKKIWDVISYDPAIIEWGLVGLAFGGKKGAVVLGGLAHLVKAGQNVATALEMAEMGIIDYTDIVNSNFPELQKIIKDHADEYERLQNTIGNMGKVITMPIPKQKKEKISPLPSSDEIKKMSDDWQKEFDKIWKAEMKANEALGKETIKIQKIKEGMWEADEKSANDAAKAAAELASERLKAYRTMYNELGKLTLKNYSQQHKLLEKQRDEYIKVTGDQELAAEWFARKEHELLRERELQYGGFFEGFGVGVEDMMDAQTTMAEHGKGVFDDMRSHWNSAVNDMVDTFIAGEMSKQSVAEVTGDMLTGMAGDVAKRMYAAAIEETISLIGVHLGLGSALVGEKGAQTGGTAGALVQIGTYLGAGVAAMLAGKAMANKFRARGGWIEGHPDGGMINAGSGMRDDVLLGYTPGARHWAMGGEYVINKDSTRMYRPLIEAINDKQLSSGGHIERYYQAGTEVPWKPAADALAMGGAMSAAHGFVKGLLPGAIAELIAFFAMAVPAMFTGKYMANKFKAKGGPIDVGYGIGDIIGDIIKKPIEIFKPIVEPFFGIPIIGDKLKAITEYLEKRSAWAAGMTNFDDFWKYVKELIRTPLEAVAKDLVTPNKYYSDPLDSITTVLKFMKKQAEPEIDLMKDLLSFENGGMIPRTGLFVGHEGERVLNSEETEQYEQRSVQMNVTIQAQVITTNDVESWLRDLQYRLKHHRIGEQTSTINLTTVGIKL